MNSQVQKRRGYGFVVGLFTGTVAGAGLAIWLVPRMASELRERVTDSARNLGHQANEQYQQASARVGEAVDELTRTGQGVRDDVADAVASGARELERYATAAKSGRGPESGKRQAAGRPASRPPSL